jgi:hypothetical protein
MENSLNDNLAIWNAVQTTDPNHTKVVEFGRKFTSIDAHWQVMQATKQFGPIGLNWGYKAEHSTLTLDDNNILAVCDITIWWRSETSRNEYGPVRGMTELWHTAKSGKQQLDEDAAKKSMTDALTKGLSHLGFSADVFLGLFDDNRYVQKMKTRFDREKAAANIDALPEDIRAIIDRVKTCKTLPEIDDLALSERPKMVGKDKAHVLSLIHI